MTYSYPTTVTPEIVTVDAFLQEKIELQNVLSEDMQATLIDVLRDEGSALGWNQSGSLYENTIHPEVTVSIDTSQSPLVIRRRASSRVEESLRGSTQSQLDSLLDQIKPQYEQALNKLWDHCFSRAIEHAAEKVGAVVKRVEEHNQNLELHTLHIYVHSY